MMNSDNPVEVGNDRSPMAKIVSEWYALNPDIRRLWVYEAGEPDPNDTRGIYVIVADACMRQRRHKPDLVSEMHWLAKTPSRAHREQGAS